MKMQQPRPVPEMPEAMNMESLSAIRRTLSAAFKQLSEHPGSHDQVRLVATLAGRITSTITASVAFHKLTKTPPSKKLEKFVTK